MMSLQRGNFDAIPEREVEGAVLAKPLWYAFIAIHHPPLTDDDDDDDDYDYYADYDYDYYLDNSKTK